MIMRNYYIVLGVGRGADRDKIHKAYRTVVKKYHPDVAQNEESTGKFLEIREAYETLSDEAKRKQYDAELEREESLLRVRNVPAVAQDRTARLNRIEDLFSSPVDEFLEGFLPGFFDLFGRNREKDLYFEAILTSEEASQGGLYPVIIPVWEPCPRCGRSGLWDYFFCPLCNGCGRVRSERTFSLSIPPHVTNGTEIRLPLGDIGLNNASITVVVYVAPDVRNIP
jgi:molecular chaperone DnaJ